MDRGRWQTRNLPLLTRLKPSLCPRCGSSIGAIDDEPIIALLSGVFDNPNDPALTPEYHSFEDMKPEWWQKLFPDSPP